MIHSTIIKRKNEYLKNQYIQYEYDLCIEEKNEYLHNPCIKILSKLLFFKLLVHI